MAKKSDAGRPSGKRPGVSPEPGSVPQDRAPEPPVTAPVAGPEGPAEAGSIVEDDGDGSDSSRAEGQGSSSGANTSGAEAPAEAPAAGEPATAEEDVAAEEPTAEAPATEEPEEPTTGEPAIAEEDVAAGEPPAEAPATEEPEEPTTGEPATEVEPAASARRPGGSSTGMVPRVDLSVDEEDRSPESRASTEPEHEAVVGSPDASTAETVPIPERAPTPAPRRVDRGPGEVGGSLAGPTVPLASAVPVTEPVAQKRPEAHETRSESPGGSRSRPATHPPDGPSGLPDSTTSWQRTSQDPHIAALDARGRLAAAMRPRATRGQLLGGLLCAVLAFALVTQARSNQSQGLSSLRQTDLVRILAGLTDEATRLEEEARTLQSTYDELRSGSGTSEAAEEAARQRLETLGILTGATRAVGPGIQLEISDPENGIGSGELLDTLQELRDAGAEAVQIGDVRVVASTAFSTNPDETGIRVDGKVLRPPYVFRAIGDPQTLASALEIPGGALEMVRQQGGQGRVTQSQNIEITAVRSVPAARHASPAPPSKTP